MSFKISSIGLNSGPMHARPALHLSHSTNHFEFFFNHIEVNISMSVFSFMVLIFI
jgi:hypothetical protein